MAAPVCVRLAALHRRAKDSSKNIAFVLHKDACVQKLSKNIEVEDRRGGRNNGKENAFTRIRTNTLSNNIQTPSNRTGRHGKAGKTPSFLPSKTRTKIPQEAFQTRQSLEPKRVIPISMKDVKTHNDCCFRPPRK